MSAPRQGEIAVEGGKLAYEIAGEGPALVLIHGFSLDMRMWQPQIAALASNHTIIRYDLRGFGRSSLPVSEYDHCADLDALLTKLDIQEPTLVGLSLGANIALRYATLEASKVRAQILAAPGLPGHAWSTPRPPEETRAHALEHGVEAGRQFWLDHALFASLNDHPEARATVHKIVADYSGWHWRETDLQAASAPIIPKLGLIDIPALILSGEHDAEGYREIAARLSRELPNAELKVIADAGHMLNLEQPDIFTELVRRFADGQMLEA